MTAFLRVRSVSSAMGGRQAQPVVIGLGTNLGQRAAMLKRAVQALSAHDPLILANLSQSQVYETPALMSEGAPEKWNLPFLNMAVLGETMLSPHALLHELKRLEHTLGRQARGHWAPREIDLDILAYGDVVLQTPALVIPHPHLLARAFALLPLAELTPHWRYPLPGPLAGTPAFALADHYFPATEALEMKKLGPLMEIDGI